MVTTTTKHYTDASSAPSYSVTTGGNNAGTTKYLPGLSGVLPIITGPDGKQNLQIQDIHGDTVSTVTVGNNQTPYLNGWSQYDEYGNPQLNTQTPDSGITYGWAGKAEKATTGTGLILMGARVYNSVTGMFSSRDPVPGGNENAYSYPNDPINGNDWTGCNQAAGLMVSILGFAAVSIFAAACPFTEGAGCIVSASIYSAIWGAAEVGAANQGTKISESENNRQMLIGAIGSAVGSLGGSGTKMLFTSKIAQMAAGGTTSIFEKQVTGMSLDKLTKPHTKMGKAATKKRERR